MSNFEDRFTMDQRQRRQCAAVLLALVSLATPALAQQGLETVGRKQTVHVEGKKSVPLRVIAKPLTNIFAHKDEKKGVVRKAQTFEVFHVYAKPSPGQPREAAWYEIGTDSVGTVVGQMKAADVIEWKQSLTMEFEPPEGRMPLLMFDTKPNLDTVVKMEGNQRASAVKQYHRTIEEIGEGQRAPDNLPIISMEPERAVDMKSQPYLMPILNYEEIEIGEWEARLLEVASATREAAGRGASNLANKEYITAATQKTDFRDASNAKVEIVYCVDLTGSMKPYVQIVLDIARQVSAALEKDPAFRDRVRFGFWGYRDNESIKGIEFDTRNFTAELQALPQFVQTLSTIKTAPALNDDYEENMATGMKDAIEKTAWTPNSIRAIVLIGDAPSHDFGHQWNTGKLSIEGVRELATKMGIDIMTIQLLDARFTKYHAAATQQFQTLANGPSKDQLAYQAVQAENMADFQKAAETLFTGLKNGALNPRSETGIPGDAPSGKFEEAVTGMFRAGVVRWIGRHKEVQAPNEVAAWVCDKDLLRPEVQALSVNLLLTKNQLDSLESMLKTVIEAGNAGMLSGRDFFTALQGVASAAVVRPDQIKKARTFAETGLVPEFLVGLPYKSTVMSMSDEIWASWSSTQQEKFLKNIAAMRELYRTLHDNPEVWMRMTEAADEGDKVVTIGLKSLP